MILFYFHILILVMKITSVSNVVPVTSPSDMTSLMPTPVPYNILSVTPSTGQTPYHFPYLVPSKYPRDKIGHNPSSPPGLHLSNACILVPRTSLPVLFLVTSSICLYIPIGTPSTVYSFTRFPSIAD